MLPFLPNHFGNHLGKKTAAQKHAQDKNSCNENYSPKNKKTFTILKNVTSSFHGCSQSIFNVTLASKHNHYVERDNYVLKKRYRLEEHATQYDLCLSINNKTFLLSFYEAPTSCYQLPWQQAYIPMWGNRPETNGLSVFDSTCEV